MVERVEIQRQAGHKVTLRPTRRRAARQVDPVTQTVTQISEGMSTLVRGHLQLARIEMTQDLRAIVKDVALGAGGTPLLMVGYLLLWVSIGFLLALVLPQWAAFLSCAGVNLLAGALLMGLGMRGAKRDRFDLSASTRELKRNKAWLSTLRKPSRIRGRPARTH